MNSFEAMGEARLLAAEGQKELSKALARAIGAMFVRLLDRLGRHLPANKATPW